MKLQSNGPVRAPWQSILFFSPSGNVSEVLGRDGVSLERIIEEAVPYTTVEWLTWQAA